VATEAPESSLFERDAELAELGAAAGRAHGGSGSLVFVEGFAGIGKSRLLEASRASAGDAGFQLLGARGSELERDYAFGVVRQRCRSRNFRRRGANRCRKNVSTSRGEPRLAGRDMNEANGSPSRFTTILKIEARDLDTDRRDETTAEAIPPAEPAQQQAAMGEAVRQLFPTARLRSFSNGVASYLDSQHLIVASYADLPSMRQRDEAGGDSQDSLFAA